MRCLQLGGRSEKQSVLIAPFCSALKVVFNTFSRKPPSNWAFFIGANSLVGAETSDGRSQGQGEPYCQKVVSRPIGSAFSSASFPFTVSANPGELGL